MKSLYANVWAKTGAFLLAVLMALAAVLSGLGILYLATDHYYDGKKHTYVESMLFERTAEPYNELAWYLYSYGTLQGKDSLSVTDARQALRTDRTNYRYCIYDEAGNILAGNNQVPYESLSRSATAAYSIYSGDNDKLYTVLGMLDGAMAVNDEFTADSALFYRLYTLRYALIAFLAVSILLGVLLLVFLLSAAGRYPDAEQPELRYLNRIPFDLYAALCGFLAVFGTYACSSAIGSTGSIGGGLGLGVALTAAVAVLLAAALMSLAAHIKTRSLWQNMLLGRICRGLWRLTKWACRGIRAFFLHLPLLWKYVLFYAAFGIINLLGVAGRSAFFSLLMILVDIGTLALLCASALQMKKLSEGGRALAGGDLAYQVNTKKMLPAFARHGEDLNSIRDGMSRAVEARMKSERMKTDLITNVSHDLKTPLTSIVSYIDLLEKEALPEGNAREYVEVLDRQSQRLKKLTTDIVEASRAASGTVQVDLQPVNLTELMQQSLGEYAARFAAADLTVITSLPEEAIMILADGRQLWRVLDNLLSNAVKYAMPGTRVYIDESRDGGEAAASIRNISRAALNISADELTERFVRGDAARSSDGSGLGLAIARDLTALQKGKLTLTIDGDLFKAEIRFQAC